VNHMPDPDLAPAELRGRPLQINAVREADSIVIALSGELDLESADRLEAAIRDVEGPEIGSIVVDLAEVSFIDSTGLSVLMDAKKRSNGRLSCVPSDHDAVTRLLELTGTTEMLSG
jgi:anti-sigma B factor antagonist